MEYILAKFIEETGTSGSHVNAVHRITKEYIKRISCIFGRRAFPIFIGTIRA